MLSSLNTRKVSLLFLVLTIAAGFLIQRPFFNFQIYISQSDHGRDLANYRDTFRGATPYRDYTNRHGPLMPYYYALFYKLLGMSIQSTLFGLNLLVIASGVVIYLICRAFLSALTSFTAAVFYWASRGAEFFYTYDHNGGVLMLLVSLLALFQYTKNPKKVYVYLGLAASFLVILIRPNIGVSTLASFLLCLVVTDFVLKRPDRKQRTVQASLLALSALLAAGAVYFFLTYGAPKEVSTELDYIQHAQWDKIPLALWILVTTPFHFAKESPINAMLTVLVLILAVKAVLFLKKSGFQNTVRLRLAFFSLIIFIIFNLNEYIVSAVWFRFLWVFTPLIILIFFIIETSLKDQKTTVSAAVILLFLAVSVFNVYKQHSFIDYSHQQESVLDIAGTRVFIHPDEKSWTETVEKTTRYLLQHTSPEEPLLSAPNDLLYNFLADRDRGLRRYSIGETTMNNPAVIDRIREKNIPFIVLSNRSETRGYRILKEREATLFHELLREEYQQVASFGDWEREAGWSTNHATRVYKIRGR